MCFSIAACQKPAGPTPSSSPTQQISVTSTPSPVTNSTGASFEEITRRYEEPLAKGSDGYEILAPFLSGSLKDVLGFEIEDIDLEEPGSQKSFDQKVLPTLILGMNKEFFGPDRKLRAQTSPVDYRRLRDLVQLVVIRADQLWLQGDKKRALELAELPLKLATAMGQRPQTVSRHLFSSSYADATLVLVPKWIEATSLDTVSLATMSEHLAKNSPRYEDIQESVNVDFAQLLNSLADDEGRENLGIGNVETSTLTEWTNQLLAIHQEAAKLYDPKSLESSQGFIEKITAASGPIQGLVIDYPEVSTIQKHSFAKYKATELGLALLGPKGAEYKKLDSDALILQVFPEDPLTTAAVQAFLKVDVQANSIKISGQKGYFALLAPDVDPVFFEHHTKP